MKKLTIVFAVLDVIIAICFFVAYSPLFENFQNTIISTALITKTHGYIAYTFYSEDHINKVVAMNSFEPIDESLNLDDIKIEPSSSMIQP